MLKKLKWLLSPKKAINFTILRDIIHPKYKMEDNSDGTTVMKCKLRTIAKDDDLCNIINDRVDKLSKLNTKGLILFRLYIHHCVEKKITPIITATHINRCFNLVKTGSCLMKSGKNLSEVRILRDLMKKYRSMFNKMPTPDFKTAARPLEYAAVQYITNIGVQIS
jgi:hypothetical protein